jgi:hypothetical protein
MKPPVIHWFEQQSAPRGTLAAAVRAADKSTVGRAWNNAFTNDALDNALRCVADTFQILQANGVALARMRLVYKNAWLHCERGPDGSCLGIFTVANVEGYDAAALEKLFKQFQVLSGIKR